MPNGCVRASCTKVSLTTGATSPPQHLIWMFSCFISTPYHRQKLVKKTTQKQVTTFPKRPPGGLYNIRSLRRGDCTESPRKVGESHRESPDYVGGELHKLCRVDWQSIMNTIQKSAYLTSKPRETPILRLTAMLPSQHLRRTTKNQKGR